LLRCKHEQQRGDAMDSGLENVDTERRSPAYQSDDDQVEEGRMCSLLEEVYPILPFFARGYSGHTRASQKSRG
jgi:hypothetical protein